MRVNDILASAQDVLNSYCCENCKSLCCHKGKVLIDRSFPKEIVPKDRIVERNDGYCDLILKGGCPLLDKKLLCTIHKEPYRPKACQEYPFFVKPSVVYIAEACPAVKDGTLKEIISKFEELGLKIIFI
ncbi:YkgJ family cysteine cluster protein [Candidatus Woesearchaeota archaeon]|nr:YkgJ family cysteine cluster protein [Candidatus Woesearchaeota archaeon]